MKTNNITLISNSLTLDEHIERIQSAKEKVQSGIFEMAQYITDAVEQLGGRQVELRERLGMSKGTISKWISIGSNSTLMGLKEDAPTSFNSLYQLTSLDNQYRKHYGDDTGKHKFVKLFIDKRITPQSERNEIEVLLKSHKETLKKKQTRKNQKLVQSLFGEVRPLEKDDNTITDIINSNMFFNTLVVIPTPEQLSRWRSLELDDYVHEDYPITDLRNTTHDGSTICLMKISIKDLEVGIRCLNGWGFNYRETLLPKQTSDGLISSPDEQVIIRGERGNNTFPKEIMTSSKSKDIMQFAENTCAKPYILIGENTDRKDWTYCVG